MECELVVCVSNWVVVLGCRQVLVNSAGSKSAKLAGCCVDWLHRITTVMRKYLAHLCSAESQ